MIKGIADRTEIIRPELIRIVECVEDYAATDLPDPGINTKVSLPEHRMQLVRAMKQEAAGTELAIITAQQKCKSLRRS
ncbi:hypothetical protein NFX46_19135 [Streptomyces phaeoluteigriseus]|uniref:Uncharacterized protein n=1 Tax=Streptomyces phaeoluteigriseus TaxID=114686 RepID=A0ABY4ZAZ5_9ACTN|nr:hypothetical protein [Streptomyces phaeoluteigriseus]USQ85685.1 hypothetical protein NFX46_19135 [Streptomyces phaeoluteigriseus]